MSEPWLRGPLPGIDPLLAPLFHTFEQCRQEFASCSEDLAAEELWLRPHGLASVGFHIRHAGGAAERLAVYLRGGQLSAEQLEALKAEGEPGASRDNLLAGTSAQFAAVEDFVRRIDTGALAEVRGVGRKALPTTVHGLIVHIAEHSLRHAGQAVTTAKLVRALRR